MSLHDYQLDMVTQIHDAWMHHRSVMLQMPTGTGKTYVIAEVVRRTLSNPTTRGQIWVIAHRRELVSQIQSTITRMVPRSMHDKVSVYSIQYLSRALATITQQPSLIIIDEAHHALAPTYTRVMHTYPQAYKLGVTATPCRMRRKGFTDLYEVLITSWDISRFIQQGYLSPFKYYSIADDSIDRQLIDSLTKRGADGDYSVSEMNAVMNTRPTIERLYDSYSQHAAGRKGIVYAISIDHAKAIAAYYATKGLRTAAVDCHTPSAERDHIMEQFRQGTLDVLCNCELITEGFDCPDVQFVQMARPTLSLALYLQMVGRGLRATAGKDHCIILDNVGEYRLFGLPDMPRDWHSMFLGTQSGKAHLSPSNSSLPTLHSSLPTLHSSLPTLHSSLPTLHSSLLTLHSSSSSQLPPFKEGRGGSDLSQFTLLNGTDWVDQLTDHHYPSQPVIGQAGNLQWLKCGRYTYARVRTSEGILPHCPHHQFRQYDHCLLFEHHIVIDENVPQAYTLRQQLTDHAFLISRGTNTYLYIIGEKKQPLTPSMASNPHRLLDKAIAAELKLHHTWMHHQIDAKGRVEPHQVGLKWGFRRSGRLIVMPRFRTITRFIGNYCTCEELPGQWGVINTLGEMVLPTQFTSIQLHEDGTANVHVSANQVIKVNLNHIVPESQTDLLQRRATMNTRNYIPTPNLTQLTFQREFRNSIKS